MRLGRLLHLTVVAAGLAWGTGRAEAVTASYDQKTTGKFGTITSKVLLKDERFRMESAVEGRTSIVLRNASGIYTYMPDEQMAMRVPDLDPAQEPIPEDYMGYLKQQQARLVRTETIDGKLCDVYQFAAPGNEGQATAWVWKEKEFPIRMELEGRDGTIVTEITNIELGVPVADGAFELPAGVQVMDMSAMMPGMGQAGTDLKQLLEQQR